MRGRTRLVLEVDNSEPTITDSRPEQADRLEHGEVARSGVSTTRVIDPPLMLIRHVGDGERRDEHGLCRRGDGDTVHGEQDPRYRLASVRPGCSSYRALADDWGQRRATRATHMLP